MLVLISASTDHSRLPFNLLHCNAVGICIVDTTRN